MLATKTTKGPFSRSSAARYLERSLLVAAVGLLVASPVGAVTGTANLAVTATVAANCSISTNALAFGAYDPVTANSSSPLDGTGSVVVTCTTGASTKVTLGQGSNADTGSTDPLPLRRMKDGGSNFLAYTLYQEAGHNNLWGNTAGSGVSHTGNGTATSITVHGRIAAGQNVPTGSYSDTVVATITF